MLEENATHHVTVIKMSLNLTWLNNVCRTPEDCSSDIIRVLCVFTYNGVVVTKKETDNLSLCGC